MKYPSDTTRKLTITLSADLVDAFRSKLRNGETVTEALKRFVAQTAAGQELT